MSDEKTLGQVYFEAYDKATRGENMAAGIAAVAEVVACRVFAEGMAAYLDEQAEHEPPKPEAASEAGDWEYSEITNWHVLNNGVPEIPTRHLQELAAIIREAANRHYGPIVTRATLDRNAAQRDRDALRESSTVEHAKRLADQLDAMEKERDAAVAECERLKQQEAETATVAMQCMAERDKANKRWTERPRYFIDGNGRLWYGGRSVVSDNFHYREFVGWTDPTKTTLQEIWIWARSDAGEEWDGVSEETARDHIAGHLPKWPREQPAATPATPADATGDDLIDAVEVGIDGWVKREYLAQCRMSVLEQIRPRFDAVRAERDRARKDRDVWKKSYLSMVEAEAELAKRPDERSCLAALMKISELLGLTGIVNPGDTVKAVEAMKAERDKLAAELAEVPAIVKWISESGVSPTFKKGRWHSMFLPDEGIECATKADAVLAAFRSTKGKEPTA